MQGVVSQDNLRVAYLGPAASFSEEAAINAFAASSQKELLPLPSFKDILSAIQKSSEVSPENFDYAVLPIENSSNGGVVQVLDLLIQCGLDPESCLFPDVEVVGEHYLQVHHCLYVNSAAVALGTQSTPNGDNRATAVPIPDLNITKLYSHPQVWGQCDHFLSEHFSPEVDRIDVSSTSAAAAFVAQNPPDDSTGVFASICSFLAGSRNNLTLVASNIEDNPGENTTRFLILRNSKRTSPLPPYISQPTPPSMPGPTYYKSLVTFTVPHKVPGSLARALAMFQKHGFNLTNITTRPSRQQNWDYVFFVECLQEGGGKKQRTDELVKDLEGVAERLHWLGSWIDRLKHI